MINLNNPILIFGVCDLPLFHKQINIKDCLSPSAELIITWHYLHVMLYIPITNTLTMVTLQWEDTDYVSTGNDVQGWQALNLSSMSDGYVSAYVSASCHHDRPFNQWVKANNKENIKLCIPGPLWGESTCNRFVCEDTIMPFTNYRIGNCHGSLRRIPEYHIDECCVL